MNPVEKELSNLTNIPEEFISAVEVANKKVFDSVLKLLSELEQKDGYIIPNKANLQKIELIAEQIRTTLLEGDYVKALTQLEQQGGLWDEAQSLYRRVNKNVKINIKKRRITFPNGASIQFSHFESEKVKEDFKGLQADFIAFDEATEFTEEQIVYLMSRNRNADVSHKGTLCMATNPHCDSFLLKWVWWCLDPITGIPDPYKRGKVRYFKRQGNGDLHWFDTREDTVS